MVRVENLKKTYEIKVKKGFFKSEKKYIEAVRKLDMTIDKGQIIGFLGINGAGKTTSIKMMSTLLLPTSGEITVDGIDAVKSPMDVKKRINMVAGGERMIYWRLTGRENLWYFGQLYGIEDRILSGRINSLLKLVGLEDKQDIPVENYSKGMKQRLQIARGLINDPDYIFMDEPTLGLDAVISRELRTYVRNIAHEEGKGILLTSHYMAEIAELCDYVYVLNDGEIIAEGTTRELAAIGINKNILHLGIEGNAPEIFSIVNKACKANDDCALVKMDDDGNSLTITSSMDLKSMISRICMEHKLVISKLYEEEPRLEDAIIKLSKGDCRDEGLYKVG